MTLDELDEATTFSGWDLDVGDFAKPLEEGTKLVFGDVAREPTNENSGVVGVSKLIHWLLLVVETHWRSTAHGWRVAHWSTTATATTLLLHAHSARSTRSTRAALILGCSGRNTHRSIPTIDTLHLTQGELLIFLGGKSNKAIATRHARDGVGHDLCGFA